MYVYKIVNTINSRVYVGLTVCSLKKRWREHRSAANTGVNKPLYRAMRKHGVDNFSIHLLYEASNFDDLRAAELRFMQELKAHVLDGGYNLTDHGARHGAPNSPRGETQHQAKLTEEMVAFIRDPIHWQTSNSALLKLIEDRFVSGLSRDTVRDARRGSSWKHLNDKYPPVKAKQGSRKPPLTAEQLEKQRAVLDKYRPQAIRLGAEAMKHKAQMRQMAHEQRSQA